MILGMIAPMEVTSALQVRGCSSSSATDFSSGVPSRAIPELIECGSITLLAFLAFMAMIASNGVDDPGWLFGAILILLVLLCFATLFFLFQRVFRAVARRPEK